MLAISCENLTIQVNSLIVDCKYLTIQIDSTTLALLIFMFMK